MSDLKTNTTALRSAANNTDSSGFGGEFTTGLSKRDKRSSVADRTALWSSQMQVSPPQHRRHLVPSHSCIMLF